MHRLTKNATASENSCPAPFFYTNIYPCMLTSSPFAFTSLPCPFPALLRDAAGWHLQATCLTFPSYWISIWVQPMRTWHCRQLGERYWERRKGEARILLPLSLPWATSPGALPRLPDSSSHQTTPPSVFPGPTKQLPILFPAPTVQSCFLGFRAFSICLLSLRVVASCHRSSLGWLLSPIWPYSSSKHFIATSHIKFPLSNYLVRALLSWLETAW